MKLSVRWPDFMADARQLAGCLTQEDVFGKGRKDPFENENHPVCVGFGKHPLEQIKDGSREIHQEGLSHLQKPIDESKHSFNVSLVPFGEDEGDHHATIFQLLLKEQTG